MPCIDLEELLTPAAERSFPRPESPPAENLAPNPEIRPHNPPLFEYPESGRNGRKEGVLVERENRLSQNLSAIRNALYPKTLSEIADEIHISKSTLQSAIATGNVNLDTAIRIANALHVSLDTLVFGTLESRKINFLQQQLRIFSWYVLLPPSKQEQFLYHFSELLKLLGNAE